MSSRRTIHALAAITLTACSSGGGAIPSPGGEGGQGGAGVPSPPEPYPRPSYRLLSETALFADVATRTVAAGVEAYEPIYALFSDGADKRRWIELPPGTAIDTTDMDRWVFPIGTRLVKEFSLNGVPLETRVIERYGERKDDYFMGAFVWNAEGTDAELQPDGQTDVLGTEHDVPAQKQCSSCHNGEAGRVLGFSAVELVSSGSAGAAERGLTFEALAANGRLSAVPEDELALPSDDATTAQAFGYLHANCGHCHNVQGTAWPDTQMVLRVSVGERDPRETELYRSVVGRNVQNYRDSRVFLRVVPGSPEDSAVVVRMRERGTKKQMPPLGSEHPDIEGVALVSEWIASLPAE
jgi:hypothetical protein